MNHRDVHHILKRLSSKLTCPHCKARISGKYIKLLNIFEQDCVFYVICPQCRANMVLGAHLDETPAEATSNFSTRILNEKELTNITETDVLKIFKSLKGFKGKFSTLFKTKKNK